MQALALLVLIYLWSSYGIGALLIALGGFGAWRLSRRAAA